MVPYMAPVMQLLPTRKTIILDLPYLKIKAACNGEKPNSMISDLGNAP